MMNVCATIVDYALGNREQPVDAVEGGSLACAVASHKSHDFTVFQEKRGTEKDLHPPVISVYVVEFESIHRR